MADAPKRQRLEVDWSTLKEEKSAQVDEWAAQLGLDLDDYRSDKNTIRSDSARVTALRHLQRCQEELQRLEVLEAIDGLTDEIAVARARATLATVEGSHGPALQWERLANELEERQRELEEEARKAAAMVGDPDSELGRLAQELLQIPQAVREELARVLAAGHMPDGWSPSKVIRLAAAGE